MDSRIFFAIMCIIFNNIGVPCFIQGNLAKGIWRIVLNYVTFGTIGVINFVLGIIVGIQVFKMSDEEFAEKKDTIKTGLPV